MNIYLIVLLVLFILYIYCYFVFSSVITILQTNVNDFKFDLLYQKQPIVINDKIKNINNILDIWFKQNIIDNNINIDNNSWITNKYKYLYIYTLYDTEILLSKPNINNKIPDEKEKIINIKLKEFQSLIIPFKWKYFIDNKNNINLYGIHDYITYFLAFFLF